MKITPLDIQQQQFKKRGGRYEAGEVDAFLEMVRLEMEDLTRINAVQGEEIKRLQAELADLRSQERLLKEAILTTQKVSEDVIALAKKRAEVVVAEAQMKSDQLLDQTRLQVERTHGEIAELRRQRVQIESQLKAILESHIKLLEVNMDDSKKQDTELDKLAMLGKKASGSD